MVLAQRLVGCRVSWAWRCARTSTSVDSTNGSAISCGEATRRHFSVHAVPSCRWRSQSFRAPDLGTQHALRGAGYLGDIAHRGFNSSGPSRRQGPSTRRDSMEISAAAAAADHRAENSVNVAIAANGVIFFAKLAVYFASGSASILAETCHSVVDIANQMLLRTGLQKSKRAPDEKYNYGYRRELFVWSLISGVGIFCLGSGVSIVHGLHHIFHPAPLEYLWASMTVLAVSAVVESYSLAVAYRSLAEGARAKGMGVREYVRLGIDPTSIAIVAEDGAAVLGLGIAAASLATTAITGSAIWDAAGSVAVGGLLGCIAVYLIQANRRALVGRSLSPTIMSGIIEALKKDLVVVEVLDAKSEEIGPGVFRLKMEIEFDGECIVRRYLAGANAISVVPGAFSPSGSAQIGPLAGERGPLDGMREDARRERLFAMFRAASLSSDSRALDAALRDYGQSITTAVGDEVDRLEKIIMEIEPSIKHVDIETN